MFERNLKNQVKCYQSELKMSKIYQQHKNQQQHHQQQNQQQQQHHHQQQQQQQRRRNKTNMNEQQVNEEQQEKIIRKEKSNLDERILSTRNLIWTVLVIFILASIELVEGALRNVNLIIEPPAVRRGQHAILRCQYDLEGAPLYSAKFYRGQLEFYRYTPGEFPNTKVFPFPGIHVDVTSSNATQVLIRNVGFGLSGNFSCEVTADAPLFSTATAIGMMQVVELPDKRPTLFTEHNRYEPGDVLRANCSTPPSRPRAELKFTINNMVVTNAETQYIRTIDNLIASRISLKLQLQGVHFSSANPSIYSAYGGGQMLNSVHGYGLGGPGNHGGGLVLRCTAQIGELYQEYKEIELGTPQKDPVPARVTLSSGSSMKNFFSYFSSAPGRSSSTPSAYILLSAALLVYICCHPTITTISSLSTTIITSSINGANSLAKALMVILIALFNNALLTTNPNYNQQQQQQQQQQEKISNPYSETHSAASGALEASRCLLSQR